VRYHHRIAVGVHDTAIRGDGLSDFVGVAGSGKTGADIEELADAALGSEIADSAGEERPVDPCPGHYLRAVPGDFLSGLEVRWVVILAADPARVHPGWMCNVRPEGARNGVGIIGWLCSLSCLLVFVSPALFGW
jgi:hypothetical protein